MVYRKHEVQTLVHHVLISTINVSSVMLGIETVFGRPYNLPQFRKSRNRRNRVYNLEDKYNTNPNEKL